MVWDRLFGTWYAGADCNERVGLSEADAALYSSGRLHVDMWNALKAAASELRDGQDEKNARADIEVE